MIVPIGTESQAVVQSGSKSAFISSRSDFGIGFALPSLMKATRTAAFYTGDE